MKEKKRSLEKERDTIGKEEPSLWCNAWWRVGGEEGCCGTRGCWWWWCKRIEKTCKCCHESTELGGKCVGCSFPRRPLARHSTLASCFRGRVYLTVGLMTVQREDTARNCFKLSCGTRNLSQRNLSLWCVWCGVQCQPVMKKKRLFYETHLHQWVSYVCAVISYYTTQSPPFHQEWQKMWFMQFWGDALWVASPIFRMRSHVKAYFYDHTINQSSQSYN